MTATKPTAALLAKCSQLAYRHCGVAASQWKANLASELAELAIQLVRVVDYGDVQGFVGLFYRHRIICIRGTDSIGEMINSGFAFREHVGGGVRVHRQFYADAETFLDVVGEDCFGGDDVGVWICGHSRGGAIATIIANALAKRLRWTNTVTHLVTFCSPRVGNSRFVDEVKEFVPHVRFQRAGDVVSLLPLPPAYLHDRAPAFFDRKGDFRPGASLWTRVFEYPLALLGHIGKRGIGAITLHSLDDLAAIIEAEELISPGGNLLTELLDR